MNPAALLVILEDWGPLAVQLAQQFTLAIENKKLSLTAAEQQDMINIGLRTSSQYLAAAGGPPPGAVPS